MSIYAKATAEKMARESDAVLSALAGAVEQAGKFMAIVARHGYNSAKAEEAYKRFAGSVGTMDAEITNAGYVRPQPPKDKAKKAKPRLDTADVDG